MKRPPPSTSAPGRAWVAALAIALGIGVWFSWPLARYADRGIPCSSQNIEKFSVRAMIPGDHLQLLYHFWLAGDMAAGKTPWFRNVYEFNTGSDAGRFRLHAQYIPFSLVASAGAARGSRALGWNLAALISLWLAAGFTWKLARRYADDPWIATAGTLVALALPFRWVNLLGGSPAGFALCWIPMLCLGIDEIVRDQRKTGGWQAGFAILFSATTDTHAFFFAALMAPAWAVFSGLAATPSPWFSRAAWTRMLRASAPLLALGILALGFALLKSLHLSGTDMAGGRTPEEIALFSPQAPDFFSWRACGLPSHVYLGFVLPALGLLAALSLVRIRRAPEPEHGEPARRGWLLALMLMGVVAVVLISMGVYGPSDALPWRAARKLLPPFRLIRQPAKIFTLLPTLLPVALALAATLWRGRGPNGARPARVFALVAALAVTAEMRAQVRATVCLVDDRQEAYAAAARDARNRGVVPRALVIPLWPGDSSFASVYEHYVSLYRIRMINGYSPAVRREYRTEVFDRFRSVNQGELSDAQADDLLARGIDLVVFHEDLFPSKVSAFPSGLSLDRLYRHPRLRILGRSRGVHAFRLLAAPQPVGAPAAPPPFHATTRDIEAERAWNGPAGADGFDDSASQSRFVRGVNPGRMVFPGVSSHTQAVWRVRARGQGSMSWGWTDGARAVPRARIPVSGGSWNWIALPRTGEPDGPGWKPALYDFEGGVDIDAALFSVEAALPSVPSLPIPPRWLAHEGYSNREDGSVRFERDRAPSSEVLRGPFLPLAAGRYRLTAECDQNAFRVPGPAETGRWFAGPAGDRNRQACAILRASDRRVTLDFNQPADLPFEIRFHFERNADVTVRSIRIDRIAP